MKQRKLFSFVLILCMLLGLVACKATTPPSDTPNNSEASESSKIPNNAQNDIPNNDIYRLYDVAVNEKEVDTALMDDFFTHNEAYTGYETLKSNTPDLLTRLRDVTPKDLEKKCSIYRFEMEGCGGLNGETFLVYDSAVYPLGTALGGYGVTEFAYLDSEENNLLYFIFSWGSGIHRSETGVFDFNTKELNRIQYDYDKLQMYDISFSLSNDGHTLGICHAEIHWSDEENSFSTVKKKDTVFYEDITKLDFRSDM